MIFALNSAMTTALMSSTMARGKMSFDTMTDSPIDRAIDASNDAVTASLPLSTAARKAGPDTSYLLSEPEHDGGIYSRALYLYEMPGRGDQLKLSPRGVRPPTDEQGERPRKRQHSRRGVLRAAALVLAALLLTAATHQRTFSSLRYRLHYSGTYHMRGVPTFGRGHPSESTVSRSLSTTRDDVGGNQDPQASEEIPRDPSRPSSPSPPPPPSSSSGAPLPLMMRQFKNRRGDRISIPRGAPLPPPLLALVEVKMCAASASEGQCLRNTGGDDNEYGISLECSWCGECVPAKMAGVMCTQ